MARIEELYEQAGVIHHSGVCPVCDAVTEE